MQIFGLKLQLSKPNQDNPDEFTEVILTQLFPQAEVN